MRFILFAALCTLTLTACSGAKEQLGLNKEAPDEFTVIKRAPLELPPNFTLRPPQPGAERPQESDPTTTARTTIFGTPIPESAKEPKTGEDALLQAAGASTADPNIRSKIAGETDLIRNKNQTVVESLLGREGEVPGSTLDASAEAQRIQETLNEGSVLTGDEAVIKE